MIIAVGTTLLFGLYLVSDEDRLKGFIVGVSIIVAMISLTGCGDSSGFMKQSEVNLAGLSFDAPSRYVEKAREICLSDKINEIERAYDQCIMIYTTNPTNFNPEAHCGDNKATNTEKVMREWDYNLSQANLYLKECLVEKASLLNSVDQAKAICYDEFERVLIQRVQSCESVFLLVF